MPVCIAALCDMGKTAIVAADRLRSEQRDALMPRDVGYVRVKQFNAHTLLLSSCTSDETEKVFLRASELAAQSSLNSPEAFADHVRIAQEGVFFHARDMVTSTGSKPRCGTGPDGEPRPWFSRSEFLVVGTQEDRALLYRINEAGRHAQLDKEYSVIGDGELTSWSALAMLRCYRNLPLAVALFYIYEAKKEGECYVRVGTETDMAILTAEGIRLLDQSTIKILEELRSGPDRPWLSKEGRTAIDRSLAVPQLPFPDNHVKLPKAFSVRDEHEFLPIQHLMSRLNRQLIVKQVATGVHVDGGSTVCWGLVYLDGQPPSRPQMEMALREAGFDFTGNYMTQVVRVPDIDDGKG